MNESLPRHEASRPEQLSQTAAFRSKDMAASLPVLAFFRDMAQSGSGIPSTDIDPRFIVVTAERGPATADQPLTKKIVEVIGIEADKLGLPISLVHNRMGPNQDDTYPFIGIISNDPNVNPEQFLEDSNALRQATNETLAGLPLDPSIRVPAPVQPS